jgi:hypothetical protein
MAIVMASRPTEQESLAEGTASAVLLETRIRASSTLKAMRAGVSAAVLETMNAFRGGGGCLFSSKGGPLRY